MTDLDMTAQLAALYGSPSLPDDQRRALVGQLKAIIKPDTSLFLIERSATRTRRAIVVSVKYVLPAPTPNGVIFMDLSEALAILFGLTYHPDTKTIIFRPHDLSPASLVSSLSRILFPDDPRVPGPGSRLSMEWL